MTSTKTAPNTSSTKPNADNSAKSPDLTLECLKVDHSVVAKELAKFRACEPVTRTLYCREWAQYIYKRHFAYNAKTQEEMSQLRTISGPGGYKLCVGGPSSDTREVASSVCTRISKQMEYYFSDVQRKNPPGEFLSNLLSECESWQKLPNSMSWLPDYFDPIIFDSFPDAIPLPDDPKDPSQLLDAIIIDKTSLALPSSSFHLLKNLKAEVLASQSQPICGHRKPMAKTPSDLEMERKIFTDKFDKVTNAVYADIENLLLDVWSDLNTTLNGFKGLMADWRKEMGPDLVMLVSEFCRNNRNKLIGFNEYWNPYAETFKKKKSTTSVEDIDKAFYHYIDNAREVTTLFDREFMAERYKAAINLVQSLQSLCGTVLEKKMEDMKAHGVEKFHKAVLDSCSTARNFVLKPEHLENVQDNVDNVKEKMDIVLKELYNELDSIQEQYEKESQKNVVGRLEKLAHKEFKKRFKKLESMQQSLRQTFASEFATNVFPEQQFAQLALVTLISVMQEGEQMECDEMDDFMFDFVDENEELLAQRDDLILDFEEGVHTGRTQLSGLIGKLYLKEGMRIQGDSLALKRQNSLLKSMGIPTDATEDPINSPPASSSGNKKKKKKKKNAASVATADNDEASVDSAIATEVLKVQSPTASHAKAVAQANGDGSKASAATAGSSSHVNSNKPAVTTPSVPMKSQSDQSFSKGYEPLTSNPSSFASKPLKANMHSTTIPTLAATETLPTTAEIQRNTSSKDNASKVDEVIVSRPSATLEKPSANAVESISTVSGTTPKYRKTGEVKRKPEASSPLTKPKETFSKNKSNTLAASNWGSPSVKSDVPPTSDDQETYEKTTDSAWPTGEPTAPLWGDKPSISFNNRPKGWGDSEKNVTSATGNLWGQQLNPQDIMDQSGWGDASHKPVTDYPSKPNSQTSNPTTIAQIQCDTQSLISNVLQESSAEAEDDTKPDLGFELSSILEEQDKLNQKYGDQAGWNDAKSNEKTAAPQTNEAGAEDTIKSTPHLPPGLQMVTPMGAESTSSMYDNMAHEPSNTLVSMVKSLQTENAQLVNALLSVQQELNTMNVRYGELVKLAREREAQKAIEMEEARRYILKLEAKVHLLEPADGNHFDVSRRNIEHETNSGHSYSNDEFGGHGREDRHRRQPLSKPRYQSTSSAFESQDRDRRRNNNMWRDNRVIKCGNCGEAGHKSSECQDACRYCGSKSHLSESCELIV